MDKYFVNDDTHTVELDDENWVKIKRQLSIADQDKLGELMLNIEMDTNVDSSLSRGERRRQAREKGTSIKSATMRPSTAAILQVSIVEWSFTDPHGASIPITPTMIGRLKTEWANLISDEVDALNPLPVQANQSSTYKPSPDDQPLSQ